MASIRRFKGDVDFLVSEVISDCCTCVAIKKANADQVFTIMSDALELRDTLFFKINHPEDKHNAKAVKKYYKDLHALLFTEVESLFARLSDCFVK